MRRHHFMSFPGRSKEEAIEQIYHGVSHDIHRTSAQGHQSYLYQPHMATLRGQAKLDITTDDLVTAFRNKYPHFVVRVVNKGILIDWS